MPSISVVIPTFNRSETLKITLERLAGQSVPPDSYEVLVIDDGSVDSTGEMVQSLIPSLPYTLRYFRHENKGPGYSQNRGIREAIGNIILIIPDDVWATKELLAQHLKIHADYPEENIAVLGKVLQSSELPPTLMHKYWDPFRYDVLDGRRELESIYFFACNISVKKNFLLWNGMFKERLGAAHEDIELGYRLGQRGLRIIYNQNALAYHYHIETLPGACSRAYERGRNFYILSENIPKTIVYPLYHICAHEAGFKIFIKLLPREIVRKILFNRGSVSYFWLPVLNRAETNHFAALFANSIAYRGTIYYHMRKGMNDSKKRKEVFCRKENCNNI